MAVKKSELIVSLIDKLSGPARGVSGALDRLTAAQARNNARLDAMHGRMLGAGAVAYGLARALGAPVRAATEFETTLEDAAQKIDLPVEKLQALGVDIRKVARDTTQSASTMAQAFDILAGKGAGQSDALAMLEPIGKAATAYRADVNDLANASYAALDNLKIPADQLGKALDIMATAGKAGSFEISDLSKYLPQLGAAYQGLGQTGTGALADIAAAAQIVRTGTGDSASAATNLNNILQKLRAPQTAAAFKKMGVNLDRELTRAAEAGLTPLEAILEITNQTLKGDMSKLGYLFSDAQVQAGLRPLLQNMELYRQIRAEALEAQGTVIADYQRRLQTGAIAGIRFANAMENVNTSIGAALLPAMAQLGETVVPIIDRFATFAENNPRLTQTVVALASGLVGLRVAAIATQFGLLWMKGGLISAAIAGLRGLQGAAGVAALAFTPVTAALRGLRSAMVGYAAAASIAGHGAALSAMGSSLLSLLNPLRLVTGALRALKYAVIGTGIGAVLVGIAMAGTWIYNNWNNLASLFKGFGDAFMLAISPLRPLLDPVIGGVSSLISWLGDLLGPIEGAEQSFGSFGVAAGRAVGNAVMAVVELPGKIVAMAGELYEAGKALGKSIYDGIVSLIDQLAGYIVSKLKGALSSVGGYISSTAHRWSGGMIGSAAPALDGTRAAGGPVSAGGAYLVGERGPEIIVPRHDGFVVPNRAIGGSGRPVSAPTTPARGNIDVGGIHVTVYSQVNESAQSLSRRIAGDVRDTLSGSFSDGAEGW